MIDFAHLLAAENIDCKVSVKSKKKALQRLSEMLFESLNCPGDLIDHDNNPENEQADRSSEELYCEMDILDAFIGRERLGSTGLGAGISVPHGRVTGLESPIACLITLEQGVDFEAPDDLEVDILFGLLVPEESTEDHLQILAHLAHVFSDKQLCEDIRAFTHNEQDQLHQRLQDWSAAHIDKNSPSAESDSANRQENGQENGRQNHQDRSDEPTEDS